MAESRPRAGKKKKRRQARALLLMSAIIAILGLAAYGVLASAGLRRAPGKLAYLPVLRVRGVVGVHFQ